MLRLYVYLAIYTDTKSFPDHGDIHISTDVKRRRRLRKTKDELPCSILPGPKTNILIFDRSSCSLTNWSPDVDFAIGYTLPIWKELLKGHACQTPTNDFCQQFRAAGLESRGNTGFQRYIVRQKYFSYNELLFCSQMFAIWIFVRNNFELFCDKWVSIKW